MRELPALTTDILNYAKGRERGAAPVETKLTYRQECRMIREAPMPEMPVLPWIPAFVGMTVDKMSWQRNAS
ncbi:MAG: hypothetical protein GF331_18960 [Chitinivibrionales bacterium]|nr:hypothetical protein [Chitinivibrionales bacterium]